MGFKMTAAAVGERGETMGEAFNADVDCITGLGITPEDMLRFSRREPFDGSEANQESVSWAWLAADAALKDLSWRNGISAVLKGMDWETRRGLVRRVAKIVEAAFESEGLGKHSSDKALLERAYDDLMEDHRDVSLERDQYWINVIQMREELDAAHDLAEEYRAYLKTVRGLLTYNYSEISDLDIKKAVKAGWLPERGFLHPVEDMKAFRDAVETGSPPTPAVKWSEGVLSITTPDGVKVTMAYGREKPESEDR